MSRRRTTTALGSDRAQSGTDTPTPPTGRGDLSCPLNPDTRRSILAKELKTWIDEDVGPLKDRPLSWLSAEHFFRDPVRPSYSNPDYFFSPADGVILYQEVVNPSDSIVDIKGKPYSLREALREPTRPA